MLVYDILYAEAMPTLLNGTYFLDMYVFPHIILTRDELVSLTRRSLKGAQRKSHKEREDDGRRP